MAAISEGTPKPEGVDGTALPSNGPLRSSDRNVSGSRIVEMGGVGAIGGSGGGGAISRTVETGPSSIEPIPSSIESIDG